MNVFLAAFVGCLFALFAYTQAALLWSRWRTRAREDARSAIPSDASEPEKRKRLIAEIRAMRKAHDVPPAQMLLAALELGREAASLGDPRDARAQGAVIAAAYAWRSHIDDDEARTIRNAMLGRGA